MHNRKWKKTHHYKNTNKGNDDSGSEFEREREWKERGRENAKKGAMRRGKKKKNMRREIGRE